MTTDTQELSLSDAMEATMHDTLEKMPAEAAGDDVVTDVATQEQTAKPTRARDASGRFAQPQETVAAAEGDDTVQGGDADEQPQAVAKPAPGSWPKELRDKFGGLPADVQEFMHRRESDISRTINQYSGKAKFADAVQQALAPHEAILRADGAEPIGAITGLMQTYQVLRNAPPAQKAAAVAQMIKRFGVDLSLVGEDGNAGNSDPHVTQLYDKVSQLEQQLVQRQHADQQAEQSHVESVIADFAKDKPHFESVKVHMGALMNAGLAKDLQDAYDQAVMAHPEIRATVLAEQESKRREDAAKAAAAARKAAAVNVTQRGTVSPAAKLGSMEDTMRETLKRLQAG